VEFQLEIGLSSMEFRGEMLAKKPVTPIPRAVLIERDDEPR
jgi:hypothetical protein